MIQHIPQVQTVTQDSTTERIFEWIQRTDSEVITECLHSAQTWITQFYLQITPCLPLLVSVHQMAPPLIEVANIRLQLTSDCRAWRDELAWLVEL